MSTNHTKSGFSLNVDVVTSFIVAALLAAVLKLGLLSALLGGLLVYHIIFFGAQKLGKIGVLPNLARILLLAVVALVVIGFFVGGGAALISFVSNGSDSLVALLKKMAQSVVNVRHSLPVWMHEYLPADIDEWQARASTWLLGNAEYFSAFGRNAGLFLVHLLFGMIIGGMVAMDTAITAPMTAPFARALRERIGAFAHAFRRIVFSQMRISALNTCLTGLFLAFVMPMLGYELPLIKTMIVVTFLVGLMPIIGNIISNTVICLIALGVGPMAAVWALAFLVLVHKLEYFINARIIGTQIQARAWEILLALLVMDAAFGIAGLIAAPIYYAYLKDELSTRKLI